MADDPLMRRAQNVLRIARARLEEKRITRTDYERLENELQKQIAETAILTVRARERTGCRVS